MVSTPPFGEVFYCKILIMSSKYFNQTYIIDYDNLSDSKKAKILLGSIKDYYDKKINVYEFSNVGEFIWSSSKDKDTDLADIGMTISELEYYLHSQDEGDLGNATGRILDTIAKYYQRNLNK
jgi:hypothetical protein